MATSAAELVAHVRLKCHDVKPDGGVQGTDYLYEDDFYLKELSLALAQHDPDLTLATLPAAEEHLVIWLCAAQVCMGRAAKQTALGSYPSMSITDVEKLEIEDGVKAEKHDPLKAAKYWLGLAKEYDDAYTASSGGRASIVSGTMTRVDRFSQQRFPQTRSLAIPVPVLQGPEVSARFGADAVLHWDVCDDPAFMSYQVHKGATEDFAISEDTLQGSVYDRQQTYWKPDDAFVTGEFYALVVFSTATDWGNRAFNVSNVVEVTE